MVCFRYIDFCIRIPGITWKLLITRMILMEIALGIKIMTKCPVHQMQGMLNLDEFTDTEDQACVRCILKFSIPAALHLTCFVTLERLRVTKKVICIFRTSNRLNMIVYFLRVRYALRLCLFMYFNLGFYLAFFLTEGVFLSLLNHFFTLSVIGDWYFF